MERNQFRMLEMEEPAELVICRRIWERGLTPIIRIQRDDATVLYVLHDKRGLYHCHRYFASWDLESWDVSVDGQGVPAVAVFSWLTDPCAITTQPHGYVRPAPVKEEE